VFLYAALFAGLSGWLYAHFLRFVSPSAFNVNAGIDYLFMAVIGGASHVWGAVIGASVLTLLKEWLKDLLPTSFGASGNYEVVMFGVLMLLLLHRASSGLGPLLSRWLIRPRKRSLDLSGEALPHRAFSPDETILKVEKSSKRFGGLVAVNALSFEVRRGEILGLIGPNGAGKSTMFNLATGVLPCDGGRIEFRGERIDGLRSSRGGAAPARRGCAATRARRPAGAPRRPRRQPAARQAAPGRDRARAERGPGAAAAGRAGRRPALRREAGPRRAAAAAARRRHEHPAGRARHGVRHAPGRPAGGDGFRREAGRRAAAGHPGRPEGDGGLPRERRVSLLEVRDLRVFYRRVEGLHRASLKVEEGAIVTVIGPNGAGKSTLLGAVMGMLDCSGEVRFRGAALAGESTEDRVQRGLCLVPERRELFGELAVEDNLVLGAFQRTRRRSEIEPDLKAVYARFPRLEERKAQLAGTLSGGERQMVALGRALMARPKLLMLDEPSLGLAPLVVKEVFHAITELRATGVSILLVEQNARAALQVADYGYVLETGETVLEGPSAELAANPRVVETYLGLAGRRAE
jgi:branched-chain amino acid transport system ATP-binding protein